MLKIKGYHILMTRGDSATITLKVNKNNINSDEFIFKPGDIVEIRIYEAKGLNKQPLLNKEFEIAESSNSVDISLNSSDTTIGEMINKSIDYWYEIQLNKEQTIIGYDDTGPKIFTLYPEGADTSESGIN